MTINKNISLIVLVSLVLLMTVPSISAEATDSGDQNARRVINVPAESRLVDLGNGLVRYDHVHHDKSARPVKSDRIPKWNPFDYKLMGVMWEYSEKFQVNLGKFNEEGKKQAIEASLFTWDVESNFQIFGDVEINDYAEYSEVLDGQNTVTYANLGSSGTIALASTWYDRSTGYIVESDVVFNSYYTWSTSDECNAMAMDLQNIATHEFGHAAGLLDLYQSKSSDNTMYGYSSLGEIKKRTLEPGDIAGIQAIYGGVDN